MPRHPDIATLEKAAKHMRANHGPAHPRHAFWDSLATLMDTYISEIERQGLDGAAPPNDPLSTLLIQTARDYLSSVSA